MYLCFLGIKFRIFHAEQAKLLRKEKDVTKVPDHTYGEREREREKKRERERVQLVASHCEKKKSCRVFSKA